jgi:hypothetical protein
MSSPQQEQSTARGNHPFTEVRSAGEAKNYKRYLLTRIILVEGALVVDKETTAIAPKSQIQVSDTVDYRREAAHILSLRKRRPSSRAWIPDVAKAVCTEDRRPVPPPLSLKTLKVPVFFKGNLHHFHSSRIVTARFSTVKCSDVARTDGSRLWVDGTAS